MIFNINFLQAETFETRLYSNDILVLRLILDTVDEVGVENSPMILYRPNIPR